MMKILTYIIGTVLINGLVIGAPYWRMLDNLGWWVRGKIEGSELFGFYDDLSWIQILLIGFCELVLVLALLDNSTGGQDRSTVGQDRSTGGQDRSTVGQEVSDHNPIEP